MERDARTTPRWLQPLQLGLLLVMIAYFLVVFQVSLSKSIPRWAMPGLWQMFTLRDPSGSQTLGEARYPGETDWRPIDLPALFPSRWGSGYRYSRNSFKKNRSRMRVLAASTCLRLEPTPEAVRFVEVRWDKVLGSAERSNVREKELHVHRCEKSVRLVGGRVLPDDVVSP